MNNKGFTLIELLVVITIMVLISSTSMVYYFRQISSLEFSASLSAIEDIIAKLDYQVHRRSITDYSMTLSTISGKETSIIYSENNIGIDYRQNLVYNWMTGIGTVDVEAVSPAVFGGSDYKTYLYKGLKQKESINTTIYSSRELQMNKNMDYKIVGAIGDNILNTLYIYHIAKQNIAGESEQFIRIVDICSTQTRDGSCGSEATIDNKQGSKILKIDGNQVSRIVIFFERQGEVHFITLT